MFGLRIPHTSAAFGSALCVGSHALAAMPDNVPWDSIDPDYEGIIEAEWKSLMTQLFEKDHPTLETTVPYVDLMGKFAALKRWTVEETIESMNEHLAAAGMSPPTTCEYSHYRAYSLVGLARSGVDLTCPRGSESRTIELREAFEAFAQGRDFVTPADVARHLGETDLEPWNEAFRREGLHDLKANFEQFEKVMYPD